MNKKFSTLAVAAMLASAFTAYAGPGDVVTNLAEGNNGKQYQLRAFVNNGSSWVDKGYLILNEKDGTLSFDETLNDVNGKSVLGKSLWCVDVTLENQGKNPIFDFVNKGEGSVLDVTVGGWSEDRTNWDNTGVYYWVNKKAAHVGGEVRGWEFTPTIGDVDRNVYMFGVGENTDADNLALSGKLFNSDLTDGVIYGLNSYISSTHIATLGFVPKKARKASKCHEGIRMTS